MSSLNRLHNVSNPHQGSFRRVLCLCSAGLLRSPTAALVLSGHPWGYNTRACGVDAAYALIPVDEALLTWAHEIVCVDTEIKEMLLAEFPDAGENRLIVTLNIPDRYPFRDPELIDLIRKQYTDAMNIIEAREKAED